MYMSLSRRSSVLIAYDSSTPLRILRWNADAAARDRIEQLGPDFEILPSVSGVIVHGAERGRELGYPTANLEQHSEGFIPADGVYAARFTANGRTMPAAVSIGNNPTFEGVRDKQVEAHVLDETLDLYGARATVEFVEYVRPMQKFDGVDSLVVQMTADEERVRQILNVQTR